MYLIRMPLPVMMVFSYNETRLLCQSVCEIISKSGLPYNTTTRYEVLPSAMFQQSSAHGYGGLRLNYVKLQSATGTVMVAAIGRSVVL